MVPTELKEGGRRGTLPSQSALTELLQSEAHQAPFVTAYRSNPAYFENPMEIRARTNAELLSIPRADPTRRAVAQARANDKVLQNAEIGVSIGEHPNLARALEAETARRRAAEPGFRDVLRPSRTGVVPDKKSFFEAGAKILSRFGTKFAPSIQEVEEIVRQGSTLKNLSPLEQGKLNQLTLRLKIMKQHPG